MNEKTITLHEFGIPDENGKYIHWIDRETMRIYSYIDGILVFLGEILVDA